jgi:hypothetical protein
MNARLRSHHELRDAVRLAGEKIIKLNFGRRADRVLDFLLREARTVAKTGVSEEGGGCQR